MPGRDKTGPRGQGPMTGRGLGNCLGANDYYGRGFGRGFGFHHGLGNHHGFGRGFVANYRFNNQYSTDDEKLILKDEIRYLKDQLAYFERRLSEIDKGDNQSVNQ